MKKYIIISLLVLFVCNINITFASDASGLAAAEAAAAKKYKLLETIPGAGTANTSTTFPEYITGIYKFAIVIVAIAALLMLTIGGFAYMASAGNQAQAGTAKKIITDALLGLIVVFLSWLILYTINPDLLNAELGLSGLRVDYEVISKKQQGKVGQKDIHCDNSAITNCENSKEDCEEKYGSGNCSNLKSSIKDDEFLGLNDDGSFTKYSKEGECYATGEMNCVSGREYKNDIRYGKEEMVSRADLRKDSNINIMMDTRTEDMTEKTREDLKKLSQSFDHISINSVLEDGKTVSLYDSSAIEVYNYAKQNDNTKEWGSSWGKKGNTKYYKISKGENKGVIVAYNKKTSKASLIMPKDDGSEYTLDELGVECNDFTNATCISE